MLAAALRFDRHRHIETEVGDERKGMAGIDRQRRQHRRDGITKVLAEPGLLFAAEVAKVLNQDTVRPQLRQQTVIETAIEIGEQFARADAHRRHLLGRQQAVRRLLRDAGIDQIARRPDADHEELVEIARAEGQEAQPLQQRHLGILGLRQDTAVVVEAAQLAVQQRDRLRRMHARRF